MANQFTFGREFNLARLHQGFYSQAHLDSHFAYSDHKKTCEACRTLVGSAVLDDGYQPTLGDCDVAKRLFAVFCEF